jgi:hypothetical protein
VDKSLDKPLAIANAYSVAMQPNRIRGKRTCPAGKHAPTGIALSHGFEHRPVARVNARHKQRVGVLRLG